SKLNDPENALRAYTYSLKLNPTDPMTLLNYAIFQTNTGVSKSIIDTTLQQFYQSYTERASSLNQRELDASMLEIAGKLVAPISGTVSQSTYEPLPLPKPAVPAQQEQADVPSTFVFSPRKPAEVKANGEDVVPNNPAPEIPMVKTKIFDDGRHRRQRGKALPTLPSHPDPAQNDGQDESTVF
ncbi:unnamed protein product, partial [Rotaria magnacalcarata]